jgi:hypothetical protein
VSELHVGLLDVRWLGSFDFIAIEYWDDLITTFTKLELSCGLSEFNISDGWTGWA